MNRDFNSKKVFVSKDAPYINECDPDHSTPATKEKVGRLVLPGVGGKLRLVSTPTI